METAKLRDAEHHIRGIDLVGTDHVYRLNGTRVEAFGTSGVDGHSEEDRRRRILRAMTKPAAPKRHLPTSPFKASVTLAPEQFAVGDRVTHDMYGLGRVIGIEDGIAVLVDFGSARMRILSPYAKMTKLTSRTAVPDHSTPGPSEDL